MRQFILYLILFVLVAGSLSKPEVGKQHYRLWNWGNHHHGWGHHYGWGHHNNWGWYPAWYRPPYRPVVPPVTNPNPVPNPVPNPAAINANFVNQLANILRSLPPQNLAQLIALLGGKPAVPGVPGVLPKPAVPAVPPKPAVVKPK